MACQVQIVVLCLARHSQKYSFMKTIKNKHPLVMRWTHWVNFPVLIIMIWTGMLIYWANDEYSITIFGHTFIRFFPDWFYKFFSISSRLAEGMAFHFLFMWFFAVNGLLYILYTVFSGEWRQLIPNKHSFKEAWLVVLHDLHIRKTLPQQDKNIFLIILVRFKLPQLRNSVCGYFC